MQDQEIIARLWARDEAGIRDMRDKYGRYCAAIARNILASREDVEEALNTTWLNAWNSIPPQRPVLLGAFLGQLTRCACLNRLRASRTQKRGGGEVALALDELGECLPGGESAEQTAARAELAAAISAFLRALPEPERSVFIRRYWYIDSVAAIARQFGFTESKVKSMLHRTRARLARRLKEEGYWE